MISCTGRSGLQRIFLSRSTDRKSTRLNSSHSQSSYAVFCLKKNIARGGVRERYYLTIQVDDAALVVVQRSKGYRLYTCKLSTHAGGKRPRVSISPCLTAAQ